MLRCCKSAGGSFLRNGIVKRRGKVRSTEESAGGNRGKEREVKRSAREGEEGKMKGRREEKGNIL